MEIPEHIERALEQNAAILESNLRMIECFYNPLYISGQLSDEDKLKWAEG